MSNSDFISEARAARRRQRRFRRRLRNRIALAISILLIMTYTFDLGLDRRSENLNSNRDGNLTSTELVRQASQLEVSTYDQSGQRQLVLRADGARLGSIDGLDIPESIRDEITPSAAGDTTDFSDFDQAELEVSSSRASNKENITVAPLDDSSFVTLNPVSVLAYEGQNLTATLSARNALLDGVEETLWLDGEVIARNLIDQSTMKTEQISMRTKTRQFSGAAPVTLDFENSSTRAVGIQGTLVDRKWTLLSSVKTVIQPLQTHSND